jgi:putative alpha-1,2-mannosidase
LVEHAEIDIGGGRKLIVEVRGNGKDRPYIQSVTWNGKPWTKSWIEHAELAKGGTLFFEMGDQPNKQFGASPKDRPPSFGQPASIAD